MKGVFLGERDAAEGGSIAMETFHYTSNHNASYVNSWLEIWDYAGGCSFRGFVVGTEAEKCLFVFFTSDVVGHDLKAGYVCIFIHAIHHLSPSLTRRSLMALIELAATPFECSQLVICLDRRTDPEESRALMKSLRWVGFELVTLEMWAGNRTPASDKWLFLGMEL
jgi:hypothetical protein